MKKHAKKRTSFSIPVSSPADLQRVFNNPIDEENILRREDVIKRDEQLYQDYSAISRQIRLNEH